MTTHYNTTIAEDAARILNTKNSDTLPSTLNVLTPVIPITRYCDIVKSTAVTNATTGTVYTTPSDKDFYLTAIHLAIYKDATATSTDTSIRAFIQGLNTGILRVPGLTLTAQSEAMTLSFPTPIKIDRNTAITIDNTTNVANIKAFGSIIGYTVETTKGV